MERGGAAGSAVNASGVGSTHPNGTAYYEYQLRQMTTTGMTAEEEIMRWA